MIIQNNKKNQIEALDLWITRSSLFWLLGLAIYLAKNNLNFLVIMLVIPLIVGLPTFYLHFEYLYFNKYQKIITKYQEKEFILYDNSEEKKYLFEEIKNIKVYACPNFYKNKSKFMFFEDYHFAIITMKSGFEIVITCYMVSPIIKFINQFDVVPVEYRKMFFPSIFLKKTSW